LVLSCFIYIYFLYFFFFSTTTKKNHTRPVPIAGRKKECGPKQVECQPGWHELAGPLKVPATGTGEMEKYL
jgi:hypothetical protein